MKTHRLSLKIVPKPQLRHRDHKYNRKIKIDPSKAYKNSLKLLLAKYKPKKLIESPVTVYILCYMPVPPSYTKKRKKELLSPWNGFPTMPHTKKPDGDNLEKAIWDAMSGLILKDDSQIFGHSLYKFYAKTPSIEIEINEYNTED